MYDFNKKGPFLADAVIIPEINSVYRKEKKPMSWENLSEIIALIEDGVVVTFRDKAGREYDAFYVFGGFYPVTPLDIKGVKEAEISDICRIAELKDMREMNRLFWGDDIEELTKVVWEQKSEKDPLILHLSRAFQACQER